MKCQTPIAITPGEDGLYVACGTDVDVGSALTYCYNAADGCLYSVYDNTGKCIEEHVISAVPKSATRGGGFTITYNMSYVKFSKNVALFRTFDITVAELISEANDVESLSNALINYNIDEQSRQEVINLYFDNDSSVSGFAAYPPGSIYLAVADADPAKLFGGTWQQLTGVFPESLFAWARVKAAICGEVLCGEVVCGQ